MAIALSPNLAFIALLPVSSAIPAVSYPAIVPKATQKALPYLVYGSLRRVLTEMALAATSLSYVVANFSFSLGSGFPSRVCICTFVVFPLSWCLVVYTPGGIFCYNCCGVGDVIGRRAGLGDGFLEHIITIILEPR